MSEIDAPGGLLTQEEAAWRFAFDHHPDGVAVISPRTGCFVSVNDAYARMHGYSCVDMKGMDVFTVYPEESREHLARILTELRSDKKKDFLTQHKRKDGSLFWSEINAVYREGEEDLLLAVCKDVTVIKELEQARDDALRRAEAASRAKSEFLSNMSHEIRTPMNGVMGMIELALMEDVSPKAHAYLFLAKESSVLLLEIINSILDFSKIEAGKVELRKKRFSLADVVFSTVETFLPRFQEKGVALSFEVSPAIPHHLIGDPGRLRQVLVNIIGNALKFTPHGAVKGVAELSRTDESGMERVRFHITDTGVGIPSEKFQAIFESFSQVGASAHALYGGTGLGLSISKSLVELMGGEIWVESVPGQGSTFFFEIPFAVASD